VPHGLIAPGLFPAAVILGLPDQLRPAPLANLLAVPWISLLVLPSALLGTFLLPVPWLGRGLYCGCRGALLDWLLIGGLTWLAGHVPAWLPARGAVGFGC
jgi:competence protein ComEC